MFLNAIMVTITLKNWKLLKANDLVTGENINLNDGMMPKKEQYGQIYAEKFISASLICKAFYGKMEAQ